MNAIQEGCPVLYSFKVLKKLDIRNEERIRVVSITREHFVETSGEEVTALYRFSSSMK